jgi:hypothetical protein
MKITIQDRLLAKYHSEIARLQENGNETYRKAVEARTFQQILTERVQRNLRLGLDKGHNLDIEV